MNGKSFGELISDLGREARDLVRGEIALARAEVSEKVSQVNSGVESMTVGGVLIYAGFLVLLYAAVVVLQDLLSPWTTQPWVAPLIIGLLSVLIGWAVMRNGRKKLKASNLSPDRTAHSIRRDSETLGGHWR